MKILVTGGAGYIGSFMVARLIDEGFNVLVLDNLERGHLETINKSSKFVKGDIKDKALLEILFSEEKIEAIMHFAGLVSVEESTKDPDLYYENNVIGSKILFETAANFNINNFIFSSSAAVYGNPEQVPIPETHAKHPTSPYGKSKLDTEMNLSELKKTNEQISFACLRYFNAAGAALDGSMGEAHDPETHIIPLAINAVKEGKEFKLYGTDYKTYDGTNIRDYIHVLDLVEAHLSALEMVISEKGSYFYNIGTGRGVSNKEVIETVKNVSGLPLEIIEAPRRAGDADQLIADATKIKSELGFSPKYSDIETIVQTAWKWHSRRVESFKVEN